MFPPLQRILIIKFFVDRLVAVGVQGIYMLIHPAHTADKAFFITVPLPHHKS